MSTESTGTPMVRDVNDLPNGPYLVAITDPSTITTHRLVIAQ